MEQQRPQIEKAVKTLTICVLPFAMIMLLRSCSDGQERINYKAALKYERDYHSMMTWMREEGEKIGEKRGIRRGEKQGHAQAMLETARNMKTKNFDTEMIREITGLMVEQIAEL